MLVRNTLALAFINGRNQGNRHCRLVGVSQSAECHSHSEFVETFRNYDHFSSKRLCPSNGNDMQFFFPALVMRNSRKWVSIRSTHFAWPNGYRTVTSRAKKKTRRTIRRMLVVGGAHNSFGVYACRMERAIRESRERERERNIFIWWCDTDDILML